MMLTGDFDRRTDLLRAEVSRRGLDSFLVTGETNVSYLCGFTGHDSIILLTARKKFFITDSRYIEEAEDALTDFEIILVKDSTYKTLTKLAKNNRLKRIGFESMNLPYEVARKLRQLLGGGILIPVRELLEELRAVKEDSEIRSIRDSVRLTKTVLEKLVENIRPGIAENSLSKAAELEFIRNGARPSFEPIVAAEENSSKPHATATRKKIADDSFVMIDIGCKLNGYNSDITRMVVVGKIKNKFKRIYDIVRTAQELAIKKICPGVRMSAIDAAARSFIQKKGFGKYFGHSLGHGVGMEVHEQPSISRTSKGLLKTGMVFTVEPAIYIPGFGGVRIEDMVLVRDKACEILSR